MPEPNRPVDPDVDLHVAAHRHELRRGALPVLGAIAAGGAIGAIARHGVTVVLGGSVWATFAVNVTGCALIGVLMVLLERLWSGRRLVRPFLGVGVLGGYTTFSAYVLDVLTADSSLVALIYLVATPVAALIAVWLGAGVTRWLVDRR